MILSAVVTIFVCQILMVFTKHIDFMPLLRPLKILLKSARVCETRVAPGL